MRGQDRVHLQPVQQGRALLGGQLLIQAGYRGRQGFADRLGTAVALAQCPDPLMLLRQVRQVKIDSEGTGDRLGARQRPACH